MEENGKKFICRLCGGDDYDYVGHSNGLLGPGATYTKDFYICKNCSTVFIDPKKFSLKESKEFNKIVFHK